MRSLSKYFINGLIVTVPIVITITVVIEVLSFTEGLLGQYLPVDFPGIGLLAVIALILFIGRLSSWWVMKRLLTLGEHILVKIPVIKFIYSSVKQVSTVLFESKHLLNEPVLVPYPQPQTMALGFVMAQVSEPFAEKLDGEHVCVFVPWSLNMTSGTTLFVPRAQVVYLDMSKESALQFALTAGAVMPQREK